MLKQTIVLMTLAVSLGCSASTEGPPPDAGYDIGTWTTEACMNARVLVGELDGTVEVSGDSSDPTVPTEESLCWGPEHPTEVVAYVVPGEGEVGVEALVGSNLPRSEEHYPTVEIRSDCDTPHGVEDPTLYCSYNYYRDFEGEDDPRFSEVGTVAMGGDVLFFHVGASVTPFSIAGPWTLSVSTNGTNAPTIASATSQWDGYTLYVDIDGGDADGNVHAVWITVWDGEGNMLDPASSSSGTPQPVKMVLDEPDALIGETSFDATANVTFSPAGEPARVEVRLVDLTRLESEPVMADVTPWSP